MITYFGSPLSEGVNVDADAAILVGFPIPNVTDSWLKAKMQIVDRLGLSGFRYVLLFAAVSNSVQAMGRVMRGLENREKYVAAVDDRFWKYRWAMPRWFTNSAVLREMPTR
ncbi:MAG: helicase C-terminal domain-containing protein [Thermoproteus sp.]